MGWGRCLVDKGLILSTSLAWELGKSLIKQESAAKPQERCQVGRDWAESLPAAGGRKVARPPGQGAEGLTSQSFSSSCRLPFGLPPRCLRAWGWQPVERPTRRPEHKAVQGQDAQTTERGRLRLGHVWEPRDGARFRSFPLVTVLGLQGKDPEHLDGTTSSSFPLSAEC